MRATAALAISARDGRGAGARLEAGIERALAKHAVKGCVQRVGSMITLFFREGPVRSWSDAKGSDTVRFGRWHAEMLAADRTGCMSILLLLRKTEMTLT